MPPDLTFRPARLGEGAALFDLTFRSVRGLAAGHYAPAQIAGWMGARTPATYEAMIARGTTTVAERARQILGFVDAEPGEVTRLFLLPEAAGAGLGRRLLEIGIARARQGHAGPIRLEATLNAEGFYRRCGFRRIGTGTFDQGGDPIPVAIMELPAA
ncbi:GNAT family N-acetyltransferase [Falsiroseomonas sp.]|uniref:GNAT family N-acetyltransferase n=1 Tax=Falsiroseomonas sp. TaxID=2870721 RepID=UPI003F70A040